MSTAPNEPTKAPPRAAPPLRDDRSPLWLLALPLIVMLPVFWVIWVLNNLNLPPIYIP